ncbi:MAG: GNAT family N-acetyltransferase [Pseudomonadota bacterium]
MTVEELAAVHARAMETPASWGANDFKEMLALPGVFCVVPPGQKRAGFALGRVVLEEAELLTLAVAPDMQRQGLGRACLNLFEEEARTLGASRLHLEVAVTNKRAILLYTSNGWQECGRRKAYYAGASSRIDAVLMSKQVERP